MKRLNSLAAWQQAFPMSIEDMADSYDYAMNNVDLGYGYLREATCNNDDDHYFYVQQTMDIESALARTMAGHA